MIRRDSNSGNKARRPQNTGLIEQGQIGISRAGHTGLYSGGFCGCLGVILCPKNGQGGLIAHIAETGQKQGTDRGAYIRESVDLVVGLASTRFGGAAFDAALFRGWPQETAFDWLGNYPQIASVLDLRSVSHNESYDSFLFEPMHSTVYLPGHIFTTSWTDADDAISESVGRLCVERGSLTVPTGKKAMPVFVFN